MSGGNNKTFNDRHIISIVKVCTMTESPLTYFMGFLLEFIYMLVFYMSNMLMRLNNKLVFL